MSACPVWRGKERGNRFDPGWSNLKFWESLTFSSGTAFPHNNTAFLASSVSIQKESLAEIVHVIHSYKWKIVSPWSCLIQEKGGFPIRTAYFQGNGLGFCAWSNSSYWVLFRVYGKIGICSLLNCLYRIKSCLQKPLWMIFFKSS